MGGRDGRDGQKHTTTPLGTELLGNSLLVWYPVRSLRFDTGVPPALDKAISSVCGSYCLRRRDGRSYWKGEARQARPISTMYTSSLQRPLQLGEPHRGQGRVSRVIIPRARGDDLLELWG